MDEQRLRARLAALDVAQQMTGFGVGVEAVDGVLPLAERLETWLMRPAPAEPIDTSGLDAMMT
jgi:hypothetical protein